MQNPKGVIAVPVLVIAVIIAGLLAGGSWWYAQQKEEKAANTNIAVVANENVNTVVVTNGNTNTSTVVNGNANVAVNGNTNTTNSESKTYTSARFGLSFSYAPTYANKKVLVKETADTIYVYTEGTTAESGQYVRKFTKGSSISLKTAIEQKFLPGYSSSDCFVKAPDTYADSILESAWETARISYPPANANASNPWAGADKCPKIYTVSNGVGYFVENSNYPTKFYFFSIGQYTIPANSVSVGAKGWEATVTLTDPTVGWKTYTNITNHYTIKYPTDWKYSESNNGNTVQFSPPDAAVHTSIELGPTFWVKLVDAITIEGKRTLTNGAILDDCVQKKKQTTVNGIAVTQQDESCMATYHATYFPTGSKFIQVMWAEVFDKNYSEYPKILSTFTFTQ